MDKRTSRYQKKVSQRQEKQAAKDVGGRIQAGSGNVKLGGGADVRKQGEIRIECKYTSGTSYNIKLSELRKVKTQALRGGLEEPVLQFAFRDKSTGRLDCYAVRPHIPHGDDDHTILAETKAKSYTVSQTELMSTFLHYEEAALGFHVNGRVEWYDVMKWDRFLLYLERRDNA
jgi:hypothetical protein